MQGLGPRWRRNQRYTVREPCIWRAFQAEAEPQRPEGERNAAQDAELDEADVGELAAHLGLAESTSGSKPCAENVQV